MWLCSRVPPKRFAHRAPNFQGVIYDPTNETAHCVPELTHDDQRV